MKSKDKSQPRFPIYFRFTGTLTKFIVSIYEQNAPWSGGAWWWWWGSRPPAVSFFNQWNKFVFGTRHWQLLLLSSTGTITSAARCFSNSSPASEQCRVPAALIKCLYMAAKGGSRQSGPRSRRGRDRGCVWTVCPTCSPARVSHSLVFLFILLSSISGGEALINGNSESNLPVIH